MNEPRPRLALRSAASMHQTVARNQIAVPSPNAPIRPIVGIKR
jgi:hypothetical protein